MTQRPADLAALQAENADLRARLEEAEETLSAIRNGEVDALILGDYIYTLDSANAAANQLRKDVLTQMDDAVIAVDLDDHIILMNPAAERQYRRSASEMLGRTRSALYHEHSADWTADRAANRTANRADNLADKTGSQHAPDRNGNYRAHSTHILDDDSSIRIEATVTQLRDGSGEVIGNLSVLRDITDQAAAAAALRESQARLQFALDSARIGEWDLDLATKVARHSLQHDRCFGYSEPVSEWSLQIMLSHIHPDDREAVADEFLRSVAAERGWHFECRVIWPDRSLHWIEAHGDIYVSPDKGRRLLGIVIDTTERKHAEEALLSADRRKDEFLATLAHELRNPLAPIRNALQILHRVDSHDERTHKAQAVIERQLQQMVHLVDDLLDVSRISAGKVELRREIVDVADAVRAAIETARSLIDAGKHTLRVRLPDPGTMQVNADFTRLCQIVANLLNNAAKYTPQGGRIDVSVERDGVNAAITVQDSGIGIRPELLPRMFDMFAQIAQTRERSQGGLGIGLALVKKLIEMHGGSVEAHSEGPGLGCRFVVRIALVSPLVHEGIAETSDAGAGDEPVASGSRVVVADDNVDSAESLGQILEMIGYDVRVVHDGAQAVAMAESHRPQIVVLDIGMPHMNGLEAAHAIRQSEWGRDMLLIALSGWGQDSDREKSRDAGFDHHCVKPVSIDELTALLSRPRT